MKNAILPAVLLGLVVSVGATPPKKENVSRYDNLWLNSPFTSVPAPDPGIKAPGVLEDFVLMGVSQLPQGYFVVLMNKKDRDERVVIAPGEENSRGFKVERVIQDPGDFKATQVEISVDGEESSVLGYDEKFLILRPVAGGTGARPTQKVKAPTRVINPPAVRRVPATPKR